MNIFHDRFSTGQVVAATGVSNSTLQSWLKRDLIVARESEWAETDSQIFGGGTPGAHRRFSFFNAMNVAVAKGLIDSGLSDLAVAMPAAARFAHVGRGKIGDRAARLPSLPIDNQEGTCLTLLCVSGEHSTVYAWTQKSADFYSTVRHLLHEPAGFVTLEINPIFQQVTKGLGYDYRDVLDFAYGPTKPE